jgi:cysteine desulfurase
MHLDLGGVAASSGSACSVGNPKPSAVLQALGLGPEWTRGGLRMTVGYENSLDDVNDAVAVLRQAVARLKPLTIYQ